MYPRIQSIDSPLTPSPVMGQQSPFNFSPAAINSFLEASESTTPLVSLRTYTPSLIELSPPGLSPIEYVAHSDNRIAVSPDPIMNNDSLSKSDEQMSCDLDGGNINNRHLNISSVLEEIELMQYKPLLDTNKIDLQAFMLLTDGDLRDMGVEDKYHRLAFNITIANLNNAFDTPY